METTQVDYLSCIQDSDFEKSTNEEELLYPECKLGRQNSKLNKRELEDSDNETQRPVKRLTGFERFIWQPNLISKLLELVKQDMPMFQSRQFKKSNIFKGIYQQLKPFCEEPGLTLEIVKKKWYNMMDHHRKILEIQQKTGRVRYYQFYEEVDELFHQFQKDSEGPVLKEDNLPDLMCDRNEALNEVTIHEESPIRQQCSITNITTQLLEDSSDGRSDIEQQVQEELEKSTRKPRKRKRVPNYSKEMELSIRDLVLEHKRMVHCELRKTRSVEKTCELKDSLSKGILNAINRRTEVLERQQSSAYRINDIYTLLQKYECKLENMDTRLLKLESTMYRIESLLEKVVDKLNKK